MNMNKLTTEQASTILDAQRVEAFDAGINFNMYLEGIYTQIGIMRHFNSCARQELIGTIGEALANSLTKAIGNYNYAKELENNYHRNSFFSDGALAGFTQEHGKLCYWLASQKPWGERQ